PTDDNLAPNGETVRDTLLASGIQLESGVSVAEAESMAVSDPVAPTDEATDEAMADLLDQDFGVLELSSDWVDPLSGRQLGMLVGLNQGGEQVMVKGSAITAHASDAAMLERRFEALRTHHGTSPQLGLKWSLALLDPAARPVLESHGAIAGARSGRPFRFDRADGDKVVVMVTDGRISETVRPDRDTDAGRTLLDFGPHLLDKMRVRGARGHLLEQCRLAAEAGVSLYIVGIALERRTEETYRTCLGDAAERHLLLTERDGLPNAFRTIRRRLTDLRLEK
ncbi:MAG: hypothetical protein AAF899_13920, partial [Pseudomonadota bacterium]